MSFLTPSSVDGKTIAEAYLKRIDHDPSLTGHLVKKDGSYQSISWKEIHSRILGIYEHTQKLGIGVGDRICLLSQTRSEWNIIDLSNLCAGIITVPIYHSSLPEDIAYIIEDCKPKLIIVEDETQKAKVETAFSIIQNKVPLISIVDDFETFAKKVDNPQLDAEFRKRALSFSPHSVASIVYTSGTTGKPKGVVLTHDNFAMELRSIIHGFSLTSEDTSLTFLPLAHILGRVESLMPIFSGMKLAFAEGINEVAKNIREVNPTILVAVPRIFEKIYSGIQSQIAASPSFKQSLFSWATQIGRETARLKAEQKSIPLTLEAKNRIADQLVFSKIRNRMGGKLRIAVSGGAPLSADLCEFFHGVGIPIVEGWGLTETCAAITVNRPDDFYFGTVGKPLGNIEIRLASDGEIQVRGGMIFKEYYNNPQATQETFTEDKWFCTGDIGEFLPRGFLKITDRKKELIVTSAGKNIAPQKIENLLKGIRYISQAMVYGDKQKYLTALVTLIEPEAIKWAKSTGIAFHQYEDLSQNPKLHQMIEDEIQLMNHHLASYETIKKFKILPRDLTIEAGELTPSLKIKRKVCVQKYQSWIDEMYL